MAHSVDYKSKMARAYIQYVCMYVTARDLHAFVCMHHTLITQLYSRLDCTDVTSTTGTKKI